MMIFRQLVSILFLVFLSRTTHAQLLVNETHFTHQDTLRGSLNPNRTWWDVLYYDIEVEPDFESKSIRGKNTIQFSGVKGSVMQIDLQQPMILDSAVWNKTSLPFNRDGNIALINFPKSLKSSSDAIQHLVLYFHGTPREAVRPPWDGGWIWTKDEKGRPWMSVACQGLGASVWYPCKDHQSDEPDNGAALTMVVPAEMTAIGNGKLISKKNQGNKISYRWEVVNPINNYTIIPYIGYYVNYKEIFKGEKGDLNCSYWVLDYDLPKAKKQFIQVPEMLQCFEWWMGPYPFYEDGYQLIEAPHLGMEHQSAVAYGNKFQNGYLGRDLSGSGYGKLWDFIIVHESGHEWFANSITTKDIADMWVHEGFTNYTETLFTQCKSGKEASEAYAQGIRKNIRNDRNIIGAYGVNAEGSGDMYAKGANMIHTLRTMMGNDTLFRAILRGLNQTYYHKTVTTGEIETYLSKNSHLDKNLQPFFDQYLRTTRIPVVEWKIKDDKLYARLSNQVKGLTMKVYLPQNDDSGEWVWLNDTWSKVSSHLNEMATASRFNKNLYVEYKRVE